MTDAYSTRKISPKQQAKHDKYLARAIAKYGADAFDYSQARFYHSLADTTITCKECLKAFKTSAYLHTRPAGGGCPHCKWLKRELSVLKQMRVRARKNEIMSNKLKRMHLTAFTYTNVRAAGLLVNAKCKHCNEKSTVKTAQHIKNPSCRVCGLDKKGIIGRNKHKEYLARAIEKHGDKYDFSKAFMKSSTAKIEVTCNTCGTSSLHTVANIIHNSDGCMNCHLNGKVSDIDSFLVKARRKFGSKYDYSLVRYGNSRTKVDIICPDHGVISQTTREHLASKTGCPECGKNLAAKKLNENNSFTPERFKEESIKRYGEVLEYDLSSFTTTRGDVRLKCKAHGWFVVNAHAHLYGRNKRKQKKDNKPTQPCSQCRQDENNKQKAARAEAKHVQNKKRLEKRLEKRREEQRLREFLRVLSVETEEEKAARLAKSRERRRKRGEKNFITRAVKIHKDEYIYDLEVLDFKTADGYVNVICKTHGVFRQKIKSHIERQRGCPDCGKLKGSGWSRSSYIDFCNDSSDGKSNLYVIKCQKGDEEFLKVGITAYSVERRFKTDMPYDYTVLYEINADAGYVYDLEKRLHRILRKKEKRYTPKAPFGGHTECFSSIKPIEPLLKELVATEQIQLIA